MPDDLVREIGRLAAQGGRIRLSAPPPAVLTVARDAIAGSPLTATLEAPAQAADALALVGWVAADPNAGLPPILTHTWHVPPDSVDEVAADLRATLVALGASTSQADTVLVRELPALVRPPEPTQRPSRVGRPAEPRRDRKAPRSLIALIAAAMIGLLSFVMAVGAPRLLAPHPVSDPAASPAIPHAVASAAAVANPFRAPRPRLSASSTVLSSALGFAIDGDRTSSWNSGAFAPASIELDLIVPTRVAGFQLVTAMSPAGWAVHTIEVATEDGFFEVAHTIEQSLRDRQSLSVELTKPLEDVRHVRITTHVSPSWVAWAEINVVVAR